jgi:tetratricopeptide (TPR) repeat protein
LRRYVGDFLWCEYHREFIQPDQSYVGILIVPPRGQRLARFKAPGFDAQGKQIFGQDDSAIRRGDSSILLSKAEANALARSLALPTLGKIYEINEPLYRVLAPEYVQFIDREQLSSDVELSLRDSRVAVTSLLGIGGAGKTALATWAVLRAYERGDFKFIVSITAKDRELTASGIQALTPSLTTFEALLDSVLEVLGFPDRKTESLDTKRDEATALLTNTGGLLYVDNLETVDDNRIIEFLDNLPVGAKAITTSRRTRVRVAVRPIEIGALTDREVLQFVRSLASLPGFDYVRQLKEPEIGRIGTACDRLPLAIRWVLSRSRSPAEAVSTADTITQSGRRGEELLEFSFRRVFEGLKMAEKRVLYTLGIFQAALPIEALLVGATADAATSADPAILDALEQLIDASVVQRIFDPNLNDYVYGLLPITRAFVSRQVSQAPELGSVIRRRLTDYFEAKDVADPDARLVVREARQGRADTETSLLDLAISAKNRGDHRTAANLFEQALGRNPRSWRVAREYAEFQRHQEHNRTAALRLYEQAAANAPRRGAERALIYREWGMLLRDSGQADATDRAIECFEEARRESPNDVLATHALATMLARKGEYRRVIELLEPLLDRPGKTRDMVAAMLRTAYDRTGEMVKAIALRHRMGWD